MQILRKPINRNKAKARLSKMTKPTKGEITMMTLDTKPTRQQLDNRAFWESLPPEGVQYDGSKYIPCYAVLRNGEPVQYLTDNGKNLGNSFTYEEALKEVEYLSNDSDNISLEITAYIETFR